MANQNPETNLAKTKVRTAKHTYEDGQADAKGWIQQVHPSIVRELLICIGWWRSRSLRAPWENCPFPPLQQKMVVCGRQYTFGFFDEVRNTFQAFLPAFSYLRHHEGVQDGRRWLAEFATESQLKNLRAISMDQSYRDLFVSLQFGDSWTPAHELVAALLDGGYPADLDGELLDDCPEFLEFWQPFVPEPMHELIQKLKLVCFHGHKLQDRDYVVGFIDGALGLSEQVELRLSEREVVR